MNIDDIRSFISSQNEKFYEYLRCDAIKSELLELITIISKSQRIYVLSGIIRDFFLNQASNKIRDLDFVVENDLRQLITYREYLSNSLNVRSNSFKGLKIHINGLPTIDIWKISDTWGIKHKQIKRPTINDLINSVFFNFSAITYDLTNRKFIYSQSFVDFLRTKELDIVYDENPNIPLCFFNIFYYVKEYDLGISQNLKKWMKQKYDSEIDFDSVQIRHNGKIMYSSSVIKDFLISQINMTYGIDWNKYLSNARSKDSEINRKELLIDKRTDFESDLGRVVCSAPLRRMHDKTQVIPLTSGDNIHTRLTHSIEVMNVAKSLAINLCRDEDFIDEYGKENAYEFEQKMSAILMTAGLVHDIGNPPFGHFGETVIQQYFKNNPDNGLLKGEDNIDFCEFDGNAQGFRILTHTSYKGDLAGLNLTYATLATYLKYPNLDRPNKEYIGTKKHGVYSAEKEIFDKVVDSCNMRCQDQKIKRHPFSFLLEAADSICYLAMDIEDGFNLKWYGKDTLIEFLDRKITDIINEGKIKNVDIEFFDSKTECYSFYKIIKKNSNFTIDENINDNDWILRFRVSVIQYLVELASENFKKNIQLIDKGEYSKELIEDDDKCVAKILQAFTKRYILSQDLIQKTELTGHKVITGLLDILLGYVKHNDKSFRQKVKRVLSRGALKTAIHEQTPGKEYFSFSADYLYDYDIIDLSPYSKQRLVVDFIAGMTDKFAVSLYQELIGIKI